MIHHTCRIPNYCINHIYDPDERIKEIEVCRNAFCEPYHQNCVLMEKISIAAEFIVAENQTVLGYCAFYANDVQNKTAYITLIAVRKEYQGQRIGQALMDAVIDGCRLKSMRSILLEVNKQNQNAIQFYHRNGFKMTEQKTEETYFMARTL